MDPVLGLRTVPRRFVHHWTAPALLGALVGIGAVLYVELWAAERNVVRAVFRNRE